MDTSDSDFTENNTAQEISIFELCKSVLKKLWLLVLVAVFSFCGTFFVSRNTDESFYLSSYMSYFYCEKELFTSSSLDNIIQVYSYIATNEDILNRVIEDAQVDLSVDEVRDMISFDIDSKNPLITVTVKGKDSGTVYSLAESLNKTVSDEITGKIKELKVDNLISPTLPEFHFISSSSIRSAINAAALSFIITIFVIIVMELYQDKVKNPLLLERRFGFVVLGNVPDYGKHSYRVF